MSESKMRVRMLMAAASIFGPLYAGEVYEIPAAMARSWITAGLAEQDKMICSAPEFKTI
jgi:hypothetical protein